MVRNRGQCNILQNFEENRCIFIFYLPINFKFLKNILGIIFYIHMLPYLCFDLIFLSKINQFILMAILLFLDLRSVLQMIFFVTFYFL